MLIYILQHPLTFQGECRQLSFPAAYMFGNKCLMKHVIATVKVPDFDFCELQCYHQPNCVSVNFKVIHDSGGLHECELNNATHRSHGNELLNRDGYVYKGAEVRNRNIKTLTLESVLSHSLANLCGPSGNAINASFGFVYSWWSLASHLSWRLSWIRVRVKFMTDSVLSWCKIRAEVSIVVYVKVRVKALNIVHVTIMLCSVLYSSRIRAKLRIRKLMFAVICVHVKLTLVLDSTWSSDGVLFNFMSTSCSNSSSYSDEYSCSIHVFLLPFIIPIVFCFCFFFYLTFPFCQLLYHSSLSFCSYILMMLRRLKYFYEKHRYVIISFFKLFAFIFVSSNTPFLSYWDINNNQYQTNLVNDSPLRSA